MVQVVTEESQKLGNEGMTRQNPTYHSPEFKSRMNDIYKEVKTYSETARQLNEEFETKISGTHVKNILVKSVAKETTENPKVNDMFESTLDKTKERWEDAWNIVGDLVSMYKKFKEQILENEDKSSAIKFLKFSPQLLNIAKEIREQLKFIQEQQNQIKEAQKTFNYSPTQINYYVQKALDEQEGKDLKKIKVLNNKENE